MHPVSRTVIQTLPVSIERVFGLLTDPSRMAEWLPGCAGTQSDKPLRKGVRFKVRFGQRTTEFEVVDFTPPTTFGWVERGERNGWKTFFRLDPTAESTAVTVRDVWAPRSIIAWLRGRLFEKRRVNSQLEAILSNVRKILAP
jgi:uncharacterized protein YndB with AHSA1/START domain